MRVLCVGRHAFLSEHLCRVFAEAGAQCDPAVGVAHAVQRARELEPHIVVCDCDLLTPSLLAIWGDEAALASVPVLAVTLRHRPHEVLSPGMCDLAGTIYLPGIDANQARRLLASVHRPRGVEPPAGWDVAAPVLPPVIR